MTSAINIAAVRFPQAICLFVVWSLLYAPLAGAHGRGQSACCASGHADSWASSPETSRRHRKSNGLRSMNKSGMMTCSMSCCHDSDRSLVTSIAFVLPPSVAVAASAGDKSADRMQPLDFPAFSIEPLFLPCFLFRGRPDAPHLT